MTTTANLQLYEQGVINFLQTCTIVFSPLSEQINLNLQAQGIAVDLSNPETFKYYLNISGEYHSSDTMMTVLSLDTKTQVNFTKDMLASSKKTRAAYVVGSSYYTALCQSYPNQTDLIKSIVYPVDIQKALTSPDLTLLGWGDGYLEENEQDNIIQDLIAFLGYTSTRWYFSFLSYEVYYTWAFWGCLWQALPNVIFSSRLKYLHTSAAHSFHIWSYLYRNLNYLTQNRGKQSNLVILVNNLLDSLNVGLVGKTVYMNTETDATNCNWVPEFVSNIIPTVNSQSLELIAPESMAEMNADLVSARLEVNNTVDYIAAQEIKISRTPLNILRTKLVEIQKIGVDQNYGSLLNKFILDTLVYAITAEIYTPSVTITDPTTNVEFTLSGKDALILYYYAVHRSCREQPVLLPTIYSPTCAFRADITAASFPATFSFEGNTYPTRSYLSLDMLLVGLGYPETPVEDPEEFSTLVAELFLVLIRYVRYSRTEGGRIALEMFLDYCNKYVLQTTPYVFSLSSAANYQSWATSHKLTTLFAKLDASVDYVTAYTALSTTIATALLPEDNPIYTFFAYTSPSTDDLYDRLRSLFVQLCSYNIAFLDTSRTSGWWFLFNRIVYQTTDIVDQQSMDLEFGLTPQVQLTDTRSIAGTAIDVGISVGFDTIDEISVVEDTMIKITPEDVRSVDAPLALEPQTSKQTDTVSISASCLLQARVIFPS